ncbi:MAG TPA: heavy metal translocating P-type ATPase, partial [Geminicoccaceae bacterium]
MVTAALAVPGAGLGPGTPAGVDEPGGPADLASFVATDRDGLRRLHLMVEGVRCGGCMRRIEQALARCEGVEEARLNLSTRRLALAWRGPVGRGGELAGIVDRLGYRTVPFDPDRLGALDLRADKELLRCLAVAGFAAANVMFLSVSVWSGHGQGMGPATRDLLHWFSALIAMPAVAYAGRPFFRSALGALRAGRANMDVPISVGVVLATAMSLSETIRGGAYAYFDSAVTLLFLLLVGRYLDGLARGRARSAAERLLALRVATVTVLDAEGRRAALPVEQVRPGMTVLAAAGERIGVDGRVAAGSSASQVDTSLITG